MSFLNKGVVVIVRITYITLHKNFRIGFVSKMHARSVLHCYTVQGA